MQDHSTLFGVIYLVVKQRCENCPARSRRVVVVRWMGRDVALCPECIAAAKRVAAGASKAA